MLDWYRDHHLAPRIKQVSVILFHLNDPPVPQADLFQDLLEEQTGREKWNQLAETMDNIVYKYGSKALGLGIWEEPEGG